MTYTNTALEYCIRSFALIRFYRSLFLAADIAVEPEVRGASMTLQRDFRNQVRIGYT